MNLGDESNDAIHVKCYYLNKLWQTLFGERCDDIGGELVVAASAASVNDDAGICASADCTTIIYPMAKYERERDPENEWIACGCF